MAGNKKISQLVDGGAGQAGDNFVIERGGVNFKVDNASISGNPGGLLLNGVVNDFIVKDEKSEVALEQRLTLPPALSFVDSTAVPPTEADTDIYLLDDSGAPNAAWDGAAQNSWVRFDGLAGLWKEIGALDGFICTLIDTGDVRTFDPTTGAWELFGVATPAGANTEIQFNNAGAFGASSLFTFDTGFGVFSCNAAAVFNDGGTDQDFRIEGLTEVNLFFVDASTDRVGIGTATPGGRFHIVGAGTGTDKALFVEDSGNVDRFFVQDNGQVVIGGAAQSVAALSITPNGTTTNIGIRIDVGGFSAVNQPAFDFSNGSFKIDADLDSAWGAGISNTMFSINHDSAVNTFSNTSTVALTVQARSDLAAHTVANFTDDSTSSIFIIKADGNVGLKTEVFGATASGVFAMGIDTAPTGGQIDIAQLYVEDWNGAVTATFKMRNEEGDIFVYKKSAAYTPTNVITTRTYDADTVTTAVLADVVGTMIADTQGNGLYG